MVLANIAWDLQKASGGRFTLGLGTQVKAHNERRFAVKWEAPGPRLREVVGAPARHLEHLADEGGARFRGARTIASTS